MSQRVLATDAAKQAAQRMGTIIQDALDHQLPQVLQDGRTLSDPAMWDGPDAVRFRSSTWPGHLADLDRTLRMLSGLDDQVKRVIDDIMRAGLEGPGAGPDHGPESESTNPVEQGKKYLDYLLSSFDMGTMPYAVKSGMGLYQALQAYEREMPAADTELAQRWSEINKLALQFDRGELSLAEVQQRADGLLNAYRSAQTFIKQPVLDAAKSFGEHGLPEGGLQAADKALGPIAIAADAYTFVHPDKGALGGPNVERWMAAANAGGIALTLAPSAAALVGIDAVAAPIPVVGEVVVAGTALYLAGDLIYQNREAIGHFLDTAGHDIARVGGDVAKDAWGGIKSGWHAFTSIF
jgi:hypothetical protein